jgi:hypothetical protein
VASYKPSASTFEDQWRGLVWPTSIEATWDPDTGVERETLKTIARASVKVPDKFVRGSPFFHTHTHTLTSLMVYTGDPSEVATSCQAPP